MPDLDTLSRPLRRVLAEWLCRLVDRLLNFQNQLRYGFIRMISSSVAETIEDQLHRPFSKQTHSFAMRKMSTWTYRNSSSHSRLAYKSSSEHVLPLLVRMASVSLSHAGRILTPVAAKPVGGACPGCVTLVSLLLLVR